MTKKKLMTIVRWALVVVCMAGIFIMSAQDGEISTHMSDIVVGATPATPSTWEQATVVMRKSAHFLSYLSLAVLAAWAFYHTVRKRPGLWTMALCMVYAASDEIHQYFVPERAMKLYDWGIDSLGALCGLGLFWLGRRYIHHKTVQRNPSNVG